VSLKRVAVFLGYNEVNKIGYTRNVEAAGEVIIANSTLYWFDPKTPLPRSLLATPSIDNSEASSVGTSRRRLSLIRRRPSNTSLRSNDEESEMMVYPDPVLSDVNIHVKPQELCAIIGSVGSGKSTLCASILNEAVLSENSNITLNGRVAYASQTAWILNKTVRDNILFGCNYDEERYNRVLDACCLRHDLEVLENGDMTEIGERGINLSGGQKQRIAGELRYSLCFCSTNVYVHLVLKLVLSLYFALSLPNILHTVARAAYSNADVFIFDDPLSALDPEVAEKVFEECILTLLKGKTRVLVTNQLQCLARCDSVVCLGKKGKVLEQGSYADLINDSSGEVTRLLKGVAPSRRSLVKREQKQDTKDEAANPEKENKKLMTKEERQTGTVKLDVYLKYIRAGGGYLLFSCVFFMYILSGEYL